MVSAFFLVSPCFRSNPYKPHSGTQQAQLAIAYWACESVFPLYSFARILSLS